MSGFAQVKEKVGTIKRSYMEQSRNPNRPRKGDIIKVSPIRKKEHIEAIKKLLKDQPRNLALFTFGINTALRASDILQIRGVFTAI